MNAGTASHHDRVQICDDHTYIKSATEFKTPSPPNTAMTKSLFERITRRDHLPQRHPTWLTNESVLVVTFYLLQGAPKIEH